MKRIALTVVAALIVGLPMSAIGADFDGHATSHSSHSHIDWD